MISPELQDPDEASETKPVTSAAGAPPDLKGRPTATDSMGEDRSHRMGEFEQFGPPQEPVVPEAKPAAKKFEPDETGRLVASALEAQYQKQDLRQDRDAKGKLNEAYDEKAALETHLDRAEKETGATKSSPSERDLYRGWLGEAVPKEIKQAMGEHPEQTMREIREQMGDISQVSKGRWRDQRVEDINKLMANLEPQRLGGWLKRKWEGGWREKAKTGGGILGFIILLMVYGFLAGTKAVFDIAGGQKKVS